jgi:hypothetical protein
MIAGVISLSSTYVLLPIHVYVDNLQGIDLAAEEKHIFYN